MRARIVFQAAFRLWNVIAFSSHGIAQVLCAWVTVSAELRNANAGTANCAHWRLAEVEHRTICVLAAAVFLFRVFACAVEFVALVPGAGVVVAAIALALDLALSLGCAHHNVALVRTILITIFGASAFGGRGLRLGEGCVRKKCEDRNGKGEEEAKKHCSKCVCARACVRL